jgi:hypothetical protein
MRCGVWPPQTSMVPVPGVAADRREEPGLRRAAVLVDGASVSSRGGRGDGGSLPSLTSARQLADLVSTRRPARPLFVDAADGKTDVDHHPAMMSGCRQTDLLSTPEVPSHRMPISLRTASTTPGTPGPWGSSLASGRRGARRRQRSGRARCRRRWQARAVEGRKPAARRLVATRSGERFWNSAGSATSGPGLRDGSAASAKPGGTSRRPIPRRQVEAGRDKRRQSARACRSPPDPEPGQRAGVDGGSG